MTPAAVDHEQPPADAPAIRRGSLSGNAGAVFGAQAASMLLGIVPSILLARYLGPVLVGRLSLAHAVWAIAMVAVAFGTPLLLTKSFSRDTEQGMRLLGPSLTLQLGLYVLAWGAVGGFVLVAGYDAMTVGLVAIVGASVLLQPFAGVARAALNGVERMGWVATADTGAKVARVVAILACIGLGASVYWVASATVLAVLTATVTLVLAARRLGVQVRPARSRIAEVYRAARPYAALHIALVAYHQVDVLAISVLASDRAVGWYGAADTVFSSVMFVPTVLLAALFPRLSRQHELAPDELPATFRRAFRLLLLIGVPIGVGTAALAEPLMVLVLGEPFRQSGPVLAVFGAALGMIYLTTLLGRFAIAVDRERAWLLVMVAATAATVALDVVLVPWSDGAFGNGAIGGAIAYVVTEASMLAVGTWLVAPWLFDRDTVLRSLGTLAAGAGLLGAVWPLRWSFVLLPVAVGVVVYVVLVVVLRLVHAEDRATLRDLATGITARLRGAGTDDATADDDRTSGTTNRDDAGGR